MKMVSRRGAILNVPVIVPLSCRNIKKANSNYTHMVVIHQHFMFHLVLQKQDINRKQKHIFLKKSKKFCKVVAMENITLHD